MEQKKKKSFKDTLNLPNTEFSIRANAKTKEPELRARWNEQELDAAVQKINKGGQAFVLHDGPPYANGHIHMGTALNKVLKDMTAKSKRMSGKYVKYVPGWDCHGLPIELKVAKDNPPPTNPSPEDKVTFKKKCRDFANGWIDVQREEFKNLGVLADWQHYYSTMSPGYEADIVRAFAHFVKGGYIERKGKTVPWCASCQTVLATAEIEYYDRKDPSIFVLFPFIHQSLVKQGPLKSYLQQNPDFKLCMLAWTTTPWTIPLNRALIMHPTAEYVVVTGTKPSTGFVVAKELAEQVCAAAGHEYEIFCTFTADELEGARAKHPLVDEIEVPILRDDSVLLESGTAVVHSAPGCGPEDYLIGVRNGLEIYSPLSSDGKYTDGILPAELKAMSVKDGQGWVIKTLMEKGRLFHKESISHSYPHCWRCKNGLMFRATDQWFCNLEKNNLVPNTIEALAKIQFVPEWGVNRLRSSIAHRTEWCISRQRQWGTPIVAFFCGACEQPLLDARLIEKVADGIAKEGIEYWDRVTPAELGVKCSCGNSDDTKISKEADILDVWFDSGVSHFAVLKNDKELEVPASMYLEGSDQHRGWFQSSVLTSMVMNSALPMDAIMTHGFVVDAKGHKMSKSLGNVVKPEEVVKQFSTDILRLWVASADFEKDIVISDQLLKNVAEVYRKIRNTCRFMLANLYDFDVAKDAISVDKLKKLDQFALMQLREMSETVQAAYNDYSFTTAYQAIANYCTIDLSQFYLDIVKDRLYVEKADGVARRSCQTVIYHTLDVLTHLMAPMLSYLAEDVHDHYCNDKKQSIHLESFVDVHVEGVVSKYSVDLERSHGVARRDTALKDVRNIGVWLYMLELRSAVLKAIEQQREQGVIKHSLEAKVALHLDANDEKAKLIANFLRDVEGREELSHFLKDWFIVSHVELQESAQGLEETMHPWVSARVEHADGFKCPRCWHWEVTEHPDGLCVRCSKVVG